MVLGGLNQKQTSIAHVTGVGMRLPDQLLKSVVYLCVPSGESAPNDWLNAATAFWVSVPSEVHKGRSYVYLATAGHALRAARNG